MKNEICIGCKRKFRDEEKKYPIRLISRDIVYVCNECLNDIAILRKPFSSKIIQKG